MGLRLAERYCSSTQAHASATGSTTTLARPPETRRRAGDPVKRCAASLRRSGDHHVIAVQPIGIKQLNGQRVHATATRLSLRAASSLKPGEPVNWQARPNANRLVVQRRQTREVSPSSPGNTALHQGRSHVTPWPLSSLRSSYAPLVGRNSTSMPSRANTSSTDAQTLIATTFWAHRHHDVPGRCGLNKVNAHQPDPTSAAQAATPPSEINGRSPDLTKVNHRKTIQFPEAIAATSTSRLTSRAALPAQRALAW